DGEVDPAREHDEGHADRDDPEDRDARQQVLDVRARQEALLRRGEVDEEADQEDEHGDVAAGARPHACRVVERALPAAILARERAQPWPPAKWAIRASVASSRESSATIRPRNMTSTRSQSVSNSGVSEDDTRIPIPRSAE